MLDGPPGGETDHQGEYDGKQAVGGEVHEPEIDHTAERFRLARVGRAGDVEIVGEQALENERDAEGE